MGRTGVRVTKEPACGIQHGSTQGLNPVHRKEGTQTNMLRGSTLKAKDNEAEGEAWQEVVVTHSTAEAGEPNRRDPGEGRGHRNRGLTEGNTMGTQEPEKPRKDV